MTNTRTPKTPLKDATIGDVQQVVAAMRADDPAAAAQFDHWTAELLEDPQIQQGLQEVARAQAEAEAHDPVAFWEHRLAYRLRTLADLQRHDAPPAILRHQQRLIDKAEAYLGYHTLRVAHAAHRAHPTPATERAVRAALTSPFFAAALAHFHAQTDRPGRAN